MEHLIRTSRLVRCVVAIILGLSFTPVSVSVVRAEWPLSSLRGAEDADVGLISDTEYVSPQFGYEVTWTDPWVARESETVSAAGVEDWLWLDAPELSDAQVTVHGVFTDQTPEDAVQERAETYLANYETAAVTPFAVGNDTAGLTAFIRDGDFTPVVYLEVRTLVEGESLVMITVVADASLASDVMVSAANFITFDGESLLSTSSVTTGVTEPTEDENATSEADATPAAAAEPSDTSLDLDEVASLLGEDETTPESEATEEPASEEEEADAGRDENGVRDNTYESPLYGYTLEWDEDVWGVDEDNTESAEDGDFLLLQSRLSQLSFQSFEGFGGDPAQCFPALEDFVLDVEPDFEIVDVETIEDENGDPIEGEEDDRVYGTYAITMTDTATDEEVEVAAYLECRALPDEESVLVIIFTTSIEDFEDEFAEAQLVIDSLEVPEDGGARAEGQTADETAEAEEAGNETSSGEGFYESPTYGFTFSYDPEIWEVDTEGSQDGTDLIVLADGPSTLQFLATEDFEGNALTCVNQTIQDISALEGVSGVELDRGPDGRTVTGGNEESFYARYTVTVSSGTFASTGDVTVYIECHSLSDDAVLLIQHIVNTERYETEGPLVAAVLETLELE